jgi:cytochrome c oxidase subunit II
MQQIPVSLWTLIAGIVVGGVSLWVGQNHNLMPVQASAQAPLVDGLFNLMIVIGTALFLVVEGTILIFMVKYRHRKGDDTDGEPIEGNFGLEVFWTAIPAVIVIALGIYSVDVYSQMGGFGTSSHPGMAHGHSSSHVAHMPGSAMAGTISDASGMEEMTGDRTAAKIGIGATPEKEGKLADLTVNVTGMQYAWIFNYPEGVVAGELHVPVGADVQLNLSASDVIHSFWVPQFRLKQDALPGIPTELRFVATKVGTYPVVCAELCGGYHGSMRTQVIVHTPEEYDSWLTEQQLAQAPDMKQAVAIKPADLSTPEFLAPYVDEMGVSSATLKSIVNSQ